MMKSYKSLKCIVLDDKYGKINSHWAYSTRKMKIIARVFYDEPGYEYLTEKIISDENVDVIAFSGRKAVYCAHRLESYFAGRKTSLDVKYEKILKVMKYHNTNLSRPDVKKNENVLEIANKGNDWAQLAINPPFDVMFIQTYGDSTLFNQINGNSKAVWVPYSYNDRLYYDRKMEKIIDIGAYFKLERHPHREEFLNRITDIANRNGFSFEFSDKYWGEEYAKKISQAKVAIHISYCGDIPWRLYESAASKTCLVTDKLGFGIEKLFENNSYIEYKKDYSDLEEKICKAIWNDAERESIVDRANKSVKKYAWGEFADNWIAPILVKKIKEKSQ